MNKVPRPTFDDQAALQNLANNPRVGSYPALQGAVAAILQGYAQYEDARGNALTVVPVGVSPAVEAYLKAHYKKPPKDLEHITSLREETEHLICPMCGSLHRGTLDHLLPQRNHAAFVVFTLNLVPACKCNSKRQEVLLGPNANERILHPYFDDCLAERLIAAHFEDLGQVPRVGLRLIVGNTHPEYSAINFHVSSIVERTAIKGYLRDQWIALCRKPSLVVRALKHNPPTHEALREILDEELEMLDDTHQGKNNWNSIFVSGLLDPLVSQWIFQQMNANGRLPNAPLI